jgi:hypothetical protein
MNKAIITIVFLISFCIPFISYAQQLDKNWEIGFGAGYYTGTQKEESMLRIRDPRIQSYERLIGKYEATLDSEPIFYFNGAYRFKDYGFFRVQVGYSEFNIDLKRDLFRMPNEDIIGKLGVMPIALNFNYFLVRKHPFKPYLIAGFTPYVIVGSQDISSAPALKLGADAGFGFEYYFTDKMAVNCDLSYHFVKMEVNPEDPYTKRGYPQSYEEINIIPDRAELAIGLKFLVY